MVPAIVVRHILAGFFAVLVLFRAVEGNNAAVALGNGQQFVRRSVFVLVSALSGKLGNDLLTAFARIVINRANLPHTPVLRKAGKGTGFAYHAAEQQSVPDIVCFAYFKNSVFCSGSNFGRQYSSICRTSSL